MTPAIGIGAYFYLQYCSFFVLSSQPLGKSLVNYSNNQTIQGKYYTQAGNF